MEGEGGYCLDRNLVWVVSWLSGSSPAEEAEGAADSQEMMRNPQLREKLHYERE